MSFKAKDLTYNSNEPSFLRKLKSQYGTGDGRHERPLARPRKQAVGDDDDDDDQPTYVIEGSEHVVSSKDFQALKSDESAKSANLQGTSKSTAEHLKRSERGKEQMHAAGGLEVVSAAEPTAAIGSNFKKRKIKRFGGGDEDINDPLKKNHDSRKKKSKKIHLAFDED